MDTEYDALAEIYDIWSVADPAYSPSYKFYVDLCGKYDEPIVELGVGTGRIAIAAALKGKNIIGIDNSSEMINLCHTKAEQTGVSDRIELIESDIRNFTLQEKANLIIIPFRTIGHLITLEDKKKALECIHENLAAGGRLVFDHYIFDEEWARAHHGIPRLMTSKQISENKRIFVWDTYLYDFLSQEMECYIAVEKTDAKGKVLSRAYHPFVFSWILPDQMEKLLVESGFKIDALYGDFMSNAFNDNSNEQLWIINRSE